MNLYDTPADVVEKALRGLGLAPDALGIDTSEMQSFLRGDFSPGVARELAGRLGLDPEALATLPDFQPGIPTIAGLRRFALPFDDEEVNAWCLERDGTTLVIDAGLGRGDLASALDPHGAERIHLLITHGHRDHVGGIRGVRDRLESWHAPEQMGGAEIVQHGDAFQLGPFRIEASDLSGHHPRAVGYQITGLERTLLVTGDAVFAGSIGGCPGPDAFSKARRTIGENLLPLPADTVLLPGHGPGTSLDQEMKRNPFLAAW